MLLLLWQQSYCQKERYVPIVESKHFPKAEVLDNDLVGMAAELLSQKIYVPNVK